MPTVDKHKLANPGDGRHIEVVGRNGSNNGQFGEALPTSEGEYYESVQGTGLGVDEPMTGLAAPLENPDPLRRRFSYRAPRPRIVRIVRKILRRRELTPEEITEREEMKARQVMEKLLRSEAEIVERLLKNTLARMGFAYKRPVAERTWFVPRHEMIRFSHIFLQPDAFWFRIDTTKLPWGVRILDIVANDATITQLSLSCGHAVTAEWHSERGAWLIVERAGGVRGIPAHVKYADMLEHIPRTYGSYAIPMGHTTNNRRIYRSLGDSLPHVLVAGSTSAGKSNMVNVIIGTLIMRNSPEDLRLIMVDLKGGLEFTFFEGIPHLLPLTEENAGSDITRTGIVYEQDQVQPAMEWLRSETRRRMDFLRKRGFKKIDDYNKRRTKGRLDRIVLVIDEWANIMLSKWGRDCEAVLTDLAAQGRAVGVHVILATQTPKSNVVTTLIKNNLPGKMAFSMTGNGSMTILENHAAKSLAPAGRYIWQHGTEEIPIQAPFMPDGHIKKIVQAVIDNLGKVELEGSDLAFDELLEWALEFNGGSLAYNKLWEKFKARISQAELKRWLAEIEGTQVEVGDTTYTVLSGTGAAPRRLIALDKTDISDPIPKRKS